MFRRAFADATQGTCTVRRGAQVVGVAVGDVPLGRVGPPFGEGHAERPRGARCCRHAEATRWETLGAPSKAFVPGGWGAPR
eukprot:10020632-Alexandrium_andersonii.AAC.1